LPHFLRILFLQLQFLVPVFFYISYFDMCVCVGSAVAL
jgi:hypothetical protein